MECGSVAQLLNRLVRDGITQGPQLTPGVSRAAWEVTGYGFIYVGVRCSSGECCIASPPSSFLITLSEVLQACSIKEPILFMLSFPSATCRLVGAVLDLASCEVSYKVYVNGVICSALCGRAAQEGATGSTKLF